MHEGAPQFLQPNGRVVSTLRPVAVDAERGWQQLMEAQAELEIDASTGDSHWGGESMDYQWALHGLMGQPAQPITRGC